MRRRKQILTCITAACCLFVLILDSKTAIKGAQAGIWLCINTVIPALFPFFVISAVLNAGLTGKNISLLRPLGELCRIPPGGESFLLLGCLGGFPVGAQTIYEAYKEKAINKECAKRLLGFCNNAGPAFVFGMAGSIFSNRTCGLLLWSIVILSAIITGFLLPKAEMSTCKIQPPAPITIPTAIERSVRSTASVCAWVILFKVVLSYIDLILFPRFSNTLKVLLINLLELSNGCISLSALSNQGLRFTICAASLSFGGLCVSMQTVSAVKELGTGMYFPGKMIQTSFSILLAYLIQSKLFSQNDRFVLTVIPVVVIISLLVFLIMIRKLKNNSGNLISNHV